MDAALVPKKSIEKYCIIKAPVRGPKRGPTTGPTVWPYSASKYQVFQRFAVRGRDSLRLRQNLFSTLLQRW